MTTPALRVDAALAAQAIAIGGKVVALCAVETTLEPTTQLFAEAARSSRTPYEVRLVPGAWALFKAGDRDGYFSAIADAADTAYRDGASIVALALIFERLWSLRQSVVAPPGMVDRVLADYKETEKRKLFELLHAPRLGMALTESCAMSPAASVSGIYLAHPDSRYFTLGKIGRDQIEDYAARKHMSVEELERWLAPNLAYDVELVQAPAA